ncbi:FtsK/SpoIIIE domain-containing protein, partial [bacterium]|nr:FtsK/SpoIIIE domain-containing protein [bacterium]
MTNFKIYTPSEYLDTENKVIISPKIAVSSFGFEIGDEIKEGDLLYKLDLIHPIHLTPMYFPIYASKNQEGWLTDILYGRGENINLGSAIFIIQTEKLKSINNLKKTDKSFNLYDWEYNNKIYSYADKFIKQLDKDYSEISKNNQIHIEKLIDNEILSFKDALGLHYNYLDQLYFNNILEDLNINSSYPNNLPLGYFQILSKNRKKKLLNLLDFPIGNVLLTSNKVDDLPFLQDLIIQSVTANLLNMNTNLIKVRGISFKDFGFSLTSLTSFSNKFLNEIVIDENNFDSLCEELESRIIEVRKKCLTTYDNLFDFNNENPDRAETFYFIFCSIDDELPDDAKKRLLKFVDSQSIGKAGIFFYVVGLENELIGSSYDLNVSIHSMDKKLNKAFLNLTSDRVNLTHLDNHKLESHLLSKKLFSSLVNKINNKKNLIKLDPFINEKETWFKQNSSEGIRAPIGYAPDKNIELIIGHGTTNYNVLIGGGVGSGKSVLLHNIILGLATRYDVNECQFLLLDYKEGTEFLPYQSLPHTHVLSTESDPVFGLKTLEYVNDEIKKRGAVFKKLGVSNISSFRSQSKDPMPRWIIIIDEFQRMFQDNSISSKVESLFDDLNRRGRAFGIHFILATQSIYDLNMTPATLSQLSVRICLKISEMDASKILHVDNLIPSTFDKPGMCIYNNNIGLINSNTQMQVPFIPTSKIKSLISDLLNKNKIKTTNHISKGQQFIVYDKQNNPSKSTPFVSIGCSQDIQKTYFNIDLNPQVSSPILITGNDKQKLKLIFKSFVREYLVNNRNVTISCL